MDASTANQPLPIRIGDPEALGECPIYKCTTCGSSEDWGDYWTCYACGTQHDEPLDLPDEE